MTLLLLPVWFALACADKEPADTAVEDTGTTPTDTMTGPTSDTGDTSPPEETACEETAGALSGTVRVSELKPDPKASARVTARSSEGDPIETLTGEDGVYSFPALPAGDWSLDAVNVFGDCSNSKGYTVTIEPCGSYVVDIYVDACFG